MIIHLGLHLDGQRGYCPANRLGEVTVGPVGLLGILELRLGISYGDSCTAERIVQYRDCLKRCDLETRFYHRTFEADELGTASTLLGWRDLWHLHGWNGAFDASASGKLKDIGEVEVLAKESVHPSVGERLSAVLGGLSRRSAGIEEIRLLDPLPIFPNRWRDVLAILPIRAELTDGMTMEPGRGFLGKLQTALSSAQDRKRFDRLQWTPDGTVTIAQAETRFLGGAWISSKLSAEAFVDLIVAPAEGNRLDTIIAAGGLTRQGFQEPSPFRPTLQVLPLALEILWEPLNFYGVLQFLTHPVCPVPGYARYALAAKLADRPGIGGEAWAEALTKIDEHYGGADSDKAKDVREQIRLWIEHPRHDQSIGVPVGTVLERVARLRDYFRSRLGDSNLASRIAFNAGYSQCEDFYGALIELERQGAQKIRPRQLQQLAAQATAHGSVNPILEAEVGAQLAITNPAAATERYDRVLWWQLSPPSLPAPYPWSQAELTHLSSAGVELPPVETVLERMASEWLRPILAARNELILLLPPKGEEVHPVWQLIEAATVGVPVVGLDELMIEPSDSTVEVEHLALQRPRRWWNLPAEIPMSWPDNNSYSSLELFVFNPYQWLLRYPAQLRPSRILAVSNDFLLFGNLAHSLIERLYRRNDALSMTVADFNSWFAEAFARLIDEEGAILLMPGRRSNLEWLRMKLARALGELREQISMSGAIEVLPEVPLKGTYSGGQLLGYADLVIRKSTGERALLDMKWSGHKKYAEKLRNNRHLQLALYAELLRQSDGVWPALAYFIVQRASLFAPDALCFPGASVVESSSNEGTAQLWERFSETWKWRKDQADRRTFEVALESIPATENEILPSNCMAMDYLNPRYNEYLTLAGWNE